jgi:hypothetical protein
LPTSFSNVFILTFVVGFSGSFRWGNSLQNLFDFCFSLIAFSLSSFFAGLNFVKNGGSSFAHCSTISQSSGSPARRLPARKGSN